MSDAALVSAAYWGALLETIADIAFAIVIIALAVELVSGRVAKHFNRKIDAAREERIADANARAASAELRLVEYRKPRGVNAEQVALLIERLRPFAGTKFDIAHTKVDREQWDFLWQLEPVFPQAGWAQKDWIGGTMFKKNNWPGDHWYGEIGAVNVQVEMHPESGKTLLPAAEALVAALNEIGITAVVSEPNNSSMNADAIHVLVGPKR